jgi:ubiquinone/menaquinone biosynthesis C-methylase UbiE
MTENYDAFNEFERSMWDQRERATGYRDSFEMLTAVTIEPMLDAVKARVGTELVDVGTGPGFVAAAAVARGAFVTGIDVADTMVELAGQRVPSARFRRGSAEDLPLPDAGVDAVVGNFVLLHLGHPDRGVSEARRVLRGGGRCAFTVWDSPTVNRALGVFHDAVARAGVEALPDVPTGPPMFGLGDSGAFATLLDDAGFESVSVVPCTGSVRADPAEWWEATLRSTPRTGFLISSQTPAVQAAIRERYDELVAPYADGAEVVLPVAAVLASATAPNS